MISGSDLKQRITLQAKSITKDAAYGTDVITWTTFAERIPAQVQDTLPSRSESVQQGIKKASRPARIRIRYRSGVTSDMRIVQHGATDRYMEIIGGPAELGQRQGLEMVAVELSTVGSP